MAAQGARPGDVEDSAHDAIANMLEGDVSAIRNPAPTCTAASITG